VSILKIIEIFLLVLVMITVMRVALKEMRILPRFLEARWELYSIYEAKIAALSGFFS